MALRTLLVASVLIGVSANPGATETTATSEEVTRTVAQQLASQCLAIVAQAARYPSKVQPISANAILADPQRPDATEYTIRGRIDLMNQHGAMIPHNYYCVIAVDLSSAEQNARMVDLGLEEEGRERAIEESAAKFRADLDRKSQDAREMMDLLLDLLREKDEARSMPEPRP